jgi:hypothetical protein
VTSPKKIAPNQRNAGNSPGPRETSRTKFNAIKHALLSPGLTELDEPRLYEAKLVRLTEEWRPVGVIEEDLIISIALDLTKLVRARTLETEHVTAMLHPPQFKAESTLADLSDLAPEYKLVDPGYFAKLTLEQEERLINIDERYQSMFTNRIQRNLHELERLQRMRRGETVPAPVVGDLTVHTATASNHAGHSRTSAAHSQRPPRANAKEVGFAASPRTIEGSPMGSPSGMLDSADVDDTTIDPEASDRPKPHANGKVALEGGTRTIEASPAESAAEILNPADTENATPNNEGSDDTAPRQDASPPPPWQKAKPRLPWSR